MHPIGVVAERTGLTPELLRVWERRYGVVEPKRDDAGRRVYSDADIERLRMLHRATSGGRSIGQVAHLAPAELEEVVRGDEQARRDLHAGPPPSEAPEVVERAMDRVRALDAAGLDIVLRRAALTAGLPAFLEGVAAPLFRRIGEDWHAGRLTPAEEHLATGVARSVLGQQLAQPVVEASASVLVVATLAGERHEIGALLAASAALLEGWRTVYLGTDLPAADVARAAERTGARAVALSIVYAPDVEATLAEVAVLRGALPAGVEVIVGGAAARDLADGLARLGVRIESSLGGLRDALHEIGSSRG
jgi:MerR family transcriptional regulator, light-induced transcriptional regulator